MLSLGWRPAGSRFDANTAFVISRLPFFGDMLGHEPSRECLYSEYSDIIPPHKIQNSVENLSAVVVSLSMSVAKLPTDRYHPTIKTYRTNDLNDNGSLKKIVVLCLILICSFKTKVGVYWQERIKDGKI